MGLDQQNKKANELWSQFLSPVSTEREIVDVKTNPLFRVFDWILTKCYATDN